jgi:hypothetical protein
MTAVRERGKADLDGKLLPTFLDREQLEPDPHRAGARLRVVSGPVSLVRIAEAGREQLLDGPCDQLGPFVPEELLGDAVGVHDAAADTIDDHDGIGDAL